MRRIVAASAIIGALLVCLPASAGNWQLNGGAPWKQRVGPGLYAGLGGVVCGEDDFCRDHHAWDSHLVGSLDATLGFFWRIIPNAVVFVDVGTALLPASVRGMNHDHGFLFRTVGGAEFHVPITGWVEAYGGFGIGFALLRFRGEIDATDETVKDTLLGVDFELRTGATFYFFSRAPGLGFGPYYRAGLVFWPTSCHDVDGHEECDEPEDQDHLPFMHHIGLELRYNF